MPDEPREVDDRPWERPGALRRDCEPHRGGLLLVLGEVSLVLSLLSACGGVTAVVGVPLGMAVLLLASQDLKVMRAGLMDPRGEPALKSGQEWAATGVALGLFNAFYWAVALLAANAGEGGLLSWAPLAMMGCVLVFVFSALLKGWGRRGEEWGWRSSDALD
jgi:hypothetical protein